MSKKKKVYIEKWKRQKINCEISKNLKELRLFEEFGGQIGGKWTVKKKLFRSSTNHSDIN